MIRTVAYNTVGVLIGTAVTLIIGPPFLVWYLGRKAWKCLIVALVCLLSNGALAAGFDAETQWQTVEATVGVRCTRGQVSYRASGTVVQFHREGFDVLTAHHVIDGASGIYVEMFTRQSHPSTYWNMYEVKVQAVLPQYDLALLRVFTNFSVPPALQLATAEPGQGESLLAVGCGNQNAPYAAPGVFLHSTGERYVSSCLTIGGFSGGPIVNQSGQLVALNVASDSQGKSFSIPLPVIRDFLHPPLVATGGTRSNALSPRQQSVGRSLIIACALLVAVLAVLFATVKVRLV